MWSLLAGLFKPVVEGVTGYFKDKAALKAAHLAGELSVIKTASQNIADWEQLHVKASTSSWKDEFVLIIYATPVVLVFVPALQPYVVAGFEALALLPQWYTGVFVAISLASFGIRATGTIKSLMGK